MVQFKNLFNNQENRKVKEVIENGDESIFIYEPNQNDIAKIIELQELISKGYGDDQTEEIDISGMRLVKDLFPLLTNISGLDEMSDEEVAHVIKNPTISLIQTQHVIEMIVTQVYKTVILSARKEILDVDFELGSLGMTEDVIAKSLAVAGRQSPKLQEIAGQIDKDYEEVLKAEAAEEGKLVSALVEEFTGSENKNITVLEEYKKTFNSDEE